MTSTFTVLPVPLDHLFSPGDDINSIVTEALATIRWPDESTGISDGDIIVVTSKVVAKAEGRVVEAATRESVIDQQAERIVAVKNTPRGVTKIVQTSHGLVLAAAGVDASNTDQGTVVLLPVDPDASARQLRDHVIDRTGVSRSWILSDVRAVRSNPKAVLSFGPGGGVGESATAMLRCPAQWPNHCPCGWRSPLIVRCTVVQ